MVKAFNIGHERVLWCDAAGLAIESIEFVGFVEFLELTKLMI